MLRSSRRLRRAGRRARPRCAARARCPARRGADRPATSVGRRRARPAPRSSGGRSARPAAGCPRAARAAAARVTRTTRAGSRGRRGSCRALTSAAQVAVGRRDDAHVDRDRRDRRRRAGPGALSSTRSSLGCRSSAELADLVEEHRAAVGRARRRRCACSSAPVNAPRSWPNSSLSIRLGGDRAAVDDHERAGRARAAAGGSPRPARSLPVPVSPSSRTVASAGAALLEHARTAARIAALWPSTSPNRSRSLSGCDSRSRRARRSAPWSRPAWIERAGVDVRHLDPVAGQEGAAASSSDRAAGSRRAWPSMDR